jgi:excisionase family DNA binding protein
MRAELQIVLDSLEQMEREQLPQLLGELETIRATALMKMSAPSPLPQRDKLLTIESAADRMGVSTDYLYRNSKTLPFTRRMGRKLLFSSVGIDAYINRSRRATA